MFIIGAGDDSDNRKTVFSVTSDGNTNSYSDVVAYS